MMTAMDGYDREEIARGLALIPSGCCILTAAGATGRTGLLASWVQQASFDPPMVTVAVKRGRPIESILAETKRFCLNVIGDDPKPLFKHFGAGFRLHDDAFAGVEVIDTPFGVELVSAIGKLACEVVGVAEAGDHHLYIARVAGATSTGGKPYVHLRKSGLSY